MRLKYLCVLDDRIVEIPISRIKNGKMIKEELAGKTVLKMEMIYETENRKPFEIVRVVFDRVTFNENGIYDVSSPTATEKFRIKLEYIYSEIIISDETKELPIPSALELPNKEELQIIKSYLNKKYPHLLENSPRAIETSIQKQREIYEEDIEKFKKSHGK